MKKRKSLKLFQSEPHCINLNFQSHILPDTLAPYVESIFYFKGVMPDHSIERVVPTGHIFIIFELDHIPRNTFNNQTLEPIQQFEKVWVSGNQKNYISISAHQNSEMFVIQFKPFGAYPFFHFDLTEITDQVVSGEKLFGSEAIEVRQDILAEVAVSDKFFTAEKWLLTRFEEEKVPPKEFIETIAWLQEDSDQPFANVVSKYPKTQKHLIDQFKKFVGLTPKYYHRIIRFNELLALLHKKEQLSWSKIAYQLGYADQSHFIKEFKHFSGFNPEEFIQLDLDQNEPNFFPLDRKG